MTSSRLPWLLLVACAAGLAAPAARAADVADEAQFYFERGNQQYRQGHLEEALAAYYTSNRLVPNRNVSFNIALPTETSFRAPWTWVACSLVAIFLSGAAAVFAYNEVAHTNGQMFAWSLVGLLGLPGAYAAILLADVLGWIVWHFVHLSFALVGWLTAGGLLLAMALPIAALAADSI